MINRKVAIVGLHRGGTSMVAGIVRALGAYMGNNLLPPSKTNPYGYFEDSDIVNMHNKIMGDQWYFPQIDFSKETKEEYANLLYAKFGGRKTFAIKDPRLCYLLPYFLESFDKPGDIKVIAVYRDPWLAAYSLAERDSIGFGLSLEISLNYTAAMIMSVNGLGERLMRIRYIDMLLKPESSVLSIARFVGANPVEGDAFQVIDRSLAHWEQKQIDLWNERDNG
jgi:hypothetical protein